MPDYLQYQDLKEYTFRSTAYKAVYDEYEEIEKKALRLKKIWNNPARSFLRDAIGVRGMATADRGVINIGFIRDQSFLSWLSENYPEYDLAQEEVLRDLIDVCERAERFIPDELESSRQDLLNYAESVLHDNPTKLVLEKLFKWYEGKMSSPFGTYNCRTREINLYLWPMVFFARAVNIDFESVFVFVMVHELAHLYTHVGRDKDGQYWENFISVDTYVLEGLAQYYTWHFLLRNGDRLPLGCDSFTEMEKYQAQEYRWFRTWRSSWEQTYMAFIETRRRQLEDKREFDLVLKEVREKIVGDEDMHHQSEFSL